MTGALPDVGAGPRAYQRIGGREMILAGVGALAACGQALNILTRVLIFSSCEGLITNPQAPDVEWSRAEQWARPCVCHSRMTLRVQRGGMHEQDGWRANV